MKYGKIDHVILFGGGQPLVEFLLLLLKKQFRVTVVISERRARDVVKISSRNITLKDYLIDNRIKYIVSDDVNTDKNVLSEITSSTLGISNGASWIFKDTFIRCFKGKLVNFHGARLPQNRGGGGFSWQILQNNRLGYSLIHQVAVGIDTGKIIKYLEFLYPMSCRVPADYEHVYVSKARSFFEEFIREIKDEKELIYVTQTEQLSTYWPRLSTEVHGFINWSWPLKEIESFICAFDSPHQGAATFVNDKLVFLKKCFSDINDGHFHPFQKGIVYRNSSGILFVAAEDGSLVVEEAKNENGEDVLPAIGIGDRFYTPVEYLEKAGRTRVFYTPFGMRITDKYALEQKKS